MPPKRLLLIVVPPLILAFFLGYEVVPWIIDRGPHSNTPLTLSWMSAVLWGAVLWWAMHHLTFQLAGLISPVKRVRFGKAQTDLRFVVLYLTRDDFVPECCQACVDQDYPGEVKVVICDDSETESFQEMVNQFCGPGTDFPRRSLLLARRSDRAGFKAGNLNHAFEAHAVNRCDWVVIVDADQHLPKTFLTELASVLAVQPSGVAYVQTGREPLGDHILGRPPTAFQRALQDEVLLFFERDMAWRPVYGFFPFLGHGGAVRESACRDMGGFPLVVSEDYAFSFAVRERRRWGVRIDHIRSAEASPLSFAAYVVRLGKFSAGAAELIRRPLRRFLASSGPAVVEKWDAIVLVATYALLPIIFINLFFSAYLCHLLWSEALSVMPPRLPYLFLSMFFLSMAVIVSVTSTWGQAVRLRFWAVAIHGAALPVMTWCFLKALFVTPVFQRTPKTSAQSPRLLATSGIVCVLGVVGMAAAWNWWSPFSPILGSSSMAQVLFPVYRWLHEESFRGGVARWLAYTPGASFVVGLVWMWFWATS